MEEVSEEFMLGIERLAEVQRKRLMELQEGQAALDAAVQALRQGRARQAAEALKQQLKNHTDGCVADISARAAEEIVPSHQGKEATQQLQRNNSAPALVVKDLPRHPRIAWQEDRGLDSTPELKETPKEKPKTHGFVPVWGLQAGLEKLTPPKVVQHHIQGGSAEGDAPGMHGHCKDQDVQDGLERGIGNGRRYIGTQSHFVQNAVTASDGPTTHGNVKDLASHLGRQRRTVQVPNQIFAGVGDAGDDIPFGEMGWLGAGRRHYAVKENIVGGVSEDQVTRTRRIPRQQRDHVHGGSGTDTPPESEVRYGRPREAAFQEGLERYIGHGRRHCPEWRQQDQIFRPEPEAVESPAHVRPIGGADHIVRTHGQATCAEDTPSEQGKRHFGARDRIGFGCSVLPSDGKEDYVQGLPRGIGQGKQRIFEKDHLMGVLRRTEDNPGSHGHSRDDDFQDGLERGIGHGKRHLASGFEAVKAEAMTSCSRCGHSFEADSRVCRMCGQKRGEVIPTPLRNACSTPMACDDTPAAGVRSEFCRTAPPRFSRPKMW